MEQLKNKKNQAQSIQEDALVVTNFASGLRKGMPDDKCPDNGVMLLENMKLFMDHGEGRTGTYEHSSTTYPVLTGRSDYAATKSGYYITKTEGNDFTNADIDRYFVWPDGSREQILEIVSATVIRVAKNDSHSAATSANYASIGGEVHGIKFNNKNRQWILHIDTRVFYADYEVTAWNAVKRLCADSLEEDRSDMDESGDFVLIGNIGGIFQVDMSKTIPEMTKLNVENEVSTIEEVDETPNKKTGRRYTYCMGILDGTGNRDRQDGNEIKIETAPNLVDSSNESKDFAEVFKDTSITETEGTYEVLVGGTTTISLERAIAIASYRQAAFNITLNGVNKHVYWGDRQVGMGISSFEGIAALVQKKMREVFAEDAKYATCEYVTDHFEFTGGKRPGTTVSYLFVERGYARSEANYAYREGVRVYDGTSNYETLLNGNAHWNWSCLFQGYDPDVPVNAFKYDISVKDYVEYGDTAEGVYPEREIDFYVQNDANPSAGHWYTTYGGSASKSTGTVSGTSVGPMTQPSGEQQFTHYMLYATPDTGPAEDLETGKRSSNPNLGRFIWHSDMPVCKAFTGSITGSTFTATEGTFEKADVGNTLTGADGSTFLITGYTSGTVVTGTASGDAGSQGFQFGADKVFTLSQTETTVTRTAGDTFSADDEDKTIHLANGEYIRIKTYTDANNVTAHDSATHASQGAAMDPTSRRFSDFVSDDTLINREQDYSLQNRYMVHLPSASLILRVPGFLYTGDRGGRQLRYSQVSYGKEYQMGYYNPVYQYEVMSDTLVAIRKLPNMIILFRGHSWARVPTNISRSLPISGSNQTISLIGGITDSDDGIGCIDAGSIAPIGKQALIFKTQEPGIRVVNGFSVSENYLADPQTGNWFLKEDMELLQNAVSSFYDATEGFVFFGTRTNIE